MDIRGCLARIAVVEKSLTISAPAVLATARVYTYWPHQSETVEDLSFMHDFDLTDVRHKANGWRDSLFVVRSRFWCGEADKPVAADISAAFLKAWMDAFSNDLTLNGACTGPIIFRGEAPTLVSLEFAGKQSIGLALVMEIPINEAVTVGI